MTDYTEVLVSTAWVAVHGKEAGTRLFEVNAGAYVEGHIATAAGVPSRLYEQLQRAVLTKEQFEALCNDNGITNDTTVIFYGDSSNLFATYALWHFRYYGHDEMRLKLMDGGRQKWLAEGGELVADVTDYASSGYRARSPDDTVRATKDEILSLLERDVVKLVDARSPAEFSGMTETDPHAGHIPGAVNIPWTMTIAADGTFKSCDELQDIYRRAGIDRGKEIITYCSAGKRAAHAWFVLKYLLGYEKVSNYDGSWNEWSSLAEVPIARS